MKRIIIVLLVFTIAAGATVAELSVSGELKTGFYMDSEKVGNLKPTSSGGMKNTESDSGSGEARARLNFHYDYDHIIGLRIRFQVIPGGAGPHYPVWDFAYAYGNLFNEQLKISAGLLGESPWGSGGPELRYDLETRHNLRIDETTGLIGIRFEYTPSFLQGLNLGFVLNQTDLYLDKSIREQSFGELLQESVLGIAYEHDYFAVRFGYRLDSEMDKYENIRMNEGARFTYRLEERALNTLLPGMQIWLNGYYYGLGSEKRHSSKVFMPPPEFFDNWLYFLYDNENFTAKFNVHLGMYQKYLFAGLDPSVPSKRDDYQALEFIPAFYYKFFNNFMWAGLRLGLGMEFGNGKVYRDSPYQFIFIEPQVRLNFTGSAYVALVYNFTDSYAFPNSETNPALKVRAGDKSQKHQVNLRVVYTF